jgi:hypothetical protein
MATGKLLRQLIKSGLEGNTEAFRAASEEVIRDERAKQHHLLANDLERLLYGRPKNFARSSAGQLERAPVDRERNIPLIDLREPVRRIEDVVLSEETRNAVEDVLQEPPLRAAAELWVTRRGSAPFLWPTWLRQDAISRSYRLRAWAAARCCASGCGRVFLSRRNSCESAQGL